MGWRFNGAALVATIHAGDCLNGCQTCAANYHEGQALTRFTCDTCAAELIIPYTLTAAR
jgi:hypothetical protein